MNDRVHERKVEYRYVVIVSLKHSVFVQRALPLQIVNVFVNK